MSKKIQSFSNVLVSYLQSHCNGALFLDASREMPIDHKQALDKSYSDRDFIPIISSKDCFMLVNSSECAEEENKQRFYSVNGVSSFVLCDLSVSSALSRLSMEHNIAITLLTKKKGFTDNPIVKEILYESIVFVSEKNCLELKHARDATDKLYILNEIVHSNLPVYDKRAPRKIDAALDRGSV